MTKRICIFFLIVFAAGIVQADPDLKNVLIKTAFEAGWESMDFSETSGKAYSIVILESDSGLLSISSFKSPGDAAAHLDQATGVPSTFRHHPSKDVGLDNISYTITWQSGIYIYAAASIKNVKQIASIFYMGLDTAGLIISPGITDPSTISGVLNVEPVADSHVYSYTYRNWNKANLGKYENLGAGWHPQGGEKRTFLKFDLTGFNANSFSSAKLKLFHTHTGGGNSKLSLGVYAITNPWQEGADTYHSGQEEKTAAIGEISWINQPSFDFDPIAQFNPGPGTNKYVEIDITSLVMAWLTGKPNYGLMIKPAGKLSGRVPETQYGFRSREFEDPKKHPLLVLSDSGSAVQTGEPGGGSAGDILDADANANGNGNGNGIRVVSATYGGNCGVTKGNVTAHIAGQCNGESECSYTVDHRIIGDPTFGCAKTYSVRYQCDNNTQTLEKYLGAEAGLGDKAVLLKCVGSYTSEKYTLNSSDNKGITLSIKKGEHISIKTQGEVRTSYRVKPEGCVGLTKADGFNPCEYNSKPGFHGLNFMALIGRFNNEWFLVGEHFQKTFAKDGKLSLVVNDTHFGDNVGSYTIVVNRNQRMPSGSAGEPDGGLDGLGKIWREATSGWHGVWTRRGNSNTFDATWSRGSAQVTGGLRVTRTANDVFVERIQSSDKNVCTRTGTIAADGKTVTGSQQCASHPGQTFSWSAVIESGSSDGVKPEITGYGQKRKQ